MGRAHLPELAALVERRLLVNFRADPAAVAPLLPPGMRPQLVDGSAVVGLCLLRMSHLRPAALPRGPGLRSEAVAHRVAVEWTDEAGVARNGVHVWRRDTGSRLAALAGGRLHPGVHGLARLHSDDGPDGIHVRLDGRDGLAVDVRTVPAAHLSGSLFPDVDAAARFFAAGEIGTSPARRDGRPLEVVGFDAPTFELEPVRVLHARSTFLDAHLPGAELDCAAVLRQTPVRWRRYSHSIVPGGLDVMS